MFIKVLTGNEEVEASNKLYAYPHPLHLHPALGYLETLLLFHTANLFSSVLQVTSCAGRPFGLNSYSF